MPELLLELLSEEIPARMQAGAARDLGRLLGEALSALSPALQTWFGTRRIAAFGEIGSGVPQATRTERGPRTGAPEAALAGFLRKHSAGREQLVAEGDYWVLYLATSAQSAAALVAQVLPGLLRRFPWPKSMRWGQGSAFTWVRPLRRILCVLDGQVVPFDLREGDDDGHGLASGDLTEGHRFMAPGAFKVASVDDWRDGLLARNVMPDPAQRAATLAHAIPDLARAHGLCVAEDAGLIDEVSGLVEWPVPLLGRIDAAYMDLPAEVMQVSMRVNQRYFQLRDAVGNAAPFFAFVSNIAAPDGNQAVIAGNERVLRARFADARHFWDLDRATPLTARVAALHDITFHARLGTQADRVRRLVRLAAHIAPLVGANREHAARAAELAKADLTTGMVGEFPDLQGIMGGYYATHDGEPAEVARAVREHYLPKGAADQAPDAPVSVALALADRLDTLVGFFGIDEKPTGSGDPYALRRAALGILRLAWWPGLDLDLRDLIGFAAAGHVHHADRHEVFGFIIERLRVQLRADGLRHDVLSAVFAAADDGNMRRLQARVAALTELLATEAGANLLAAYRRAANILRIEDRRDGPHVGAVEVAALVEPAEIALHTALAAAGPIIRATLPNGQVLEAMTIMGDLRPAVDAFFDSVKVNDTIPNLRANRLRLLGALRGTMNTAADFSRIEG